MSLVLARRSPLRHLHSSLRVLALLVAAAIALTASAPLSANGLLTAKPEEVGMSSERLQRIAPRMQAYLERGEMAGALALVARRGKVVYFETWGDLDRENKRPTTPDTIYRIYSMTKPITSVAAMILYEEGRFFLNDPIGKYLPELAKLEVLEEVKDETTGEVRWQQVPAKRPVTVRDLLRHTGGFTYGFFGNTPVDKQYRDAGLLLEDRDLAEMVTKLGKIPLLHQPGERWHYNVGVDLLGRLVEVVSDMPFDRFLAERIFQPLGMVDTSFAVPESKLDRFAQLYAPKGTGDSSDVFLQRNDTREIEVAAARASRNYFGKPTFFSGGGGLVSTATDYLRFSQMMLNGGELDGVRILSPKTVELMTVNQLGDIEMGMGQEGYGFGLGYAVALDPGRVGEYTSPGEFNWGGAAGTSFWIDPEEELIGVFMIQILPHRTTIGREFRQFVYQAIVD